MCLGIDSFGFILFKVHWAFWISKFMSLTKSEKYLPIISSNEILNKFILDAPHNILVPWPGIKHVPSTQSLNHWTTRDVASSIKFLHHTLFSLLLKSDNENVRLFGIVPHVLRALIIVFLLLIFFSLFRLDNSYWSIVTWLLSILLLILSWMFYFSYCIFKFPANFYLVLHYIFTLCLNFFYLSSHLKRIHSNLEYNYNSCFSIFIQ